MNTVNTLNNPLPRSNIDVLRTEEYSDAPLQAMVTLVAIKVRKYHKYPEIITSNDMKSQITDDEWSYLSKELTSWPNPWRRLTVTWMFSELVFFIVILCFIIFLCLFLVILVVLVAFGTFGLQLKDGMPCSESFNVHPKSSRMIEASRIGGQMRVDLSRSFCKAQMFQAFPSLYHELNRIYPSVCFIHLPVFQTNAAIPET